MGMGMSDVLETARHLLHSRQREVLQRLEGAVLQNVMKRVEKTLYGKEEHQSIYIPLDCGIWILSFSQRLSSRHLRWLHYMEKAFEREVVHYAPNRAQTPFAEKRKNCIPMYKIHVQTRRALRFHVR